MTLQETLDLTDQFLAYDLDSYLGSSATAAQKITAINWAMREIGKRARLFDPSIAITLAVGQAVYELRSLAADGRLILKPRKVVANRQPLADASGKGYGVWSLDELERAHPQWRTAAAGTPTKAAVIGTKLVLHPPPDAAAVAAGNHYVSGTWMPKPLTISDLSAQLALPIETHEAVAAAAAVKLATPTATEAPQMQRLQAFAAQWMSTVDELARENDATMTSWGTTDGNEGDEYLWI